MLAASIFDHPALLLLIAFIALVRWLVSKAKAQTQETQTPIEPPPSQPITRGGETQSEEERIRKFLEALGQPAGTRPPTVRPRPRSVIPQIFPKLPTLKTVPPPLPAERTIPSVTPTPPPFEAAPVYVPTPLESDFQVHDFVRQTSSEPPKEQRRASRFDARVKLGTRQDLRTAIVLREIFGPPRSLKPLDLTSGVY
jgi:hypothetical protein